MNNSLCIVAWVYGKKYQGWIPLYVYSIVRNYPQYDIVICLDSILNPAVRNMLNEDLNNANYRIIENTELEQEYCDSDMIKRCYRWLWNNEEVTNKYEYIYIGDIDMYIEKEEPSLLRQHVDDMKNTGLIYSNSLRLRFRDYIYATKSVKCAHNYLMRLSGLHFVKSRDYYKKVSFAQEYIKRKIKKRSRLFEKLFFRDDERCLWIINAIARMGFPPKSYEIDDKAFRPLHGVHFAVGREMESYRKLFAFNQAKNNEHYMLFQNFAKDYNEDPKMRRIIHNSTYYVWKIINNTCEFWGKTMTNDEIRDR